MAKYIFIYMGVVSIITFFLYGIDKSLAKAEARRIPEKVLFLWGFLGGAVGGFLGMGFFRHKTLHLSFYIMNALAFLLHVGILFLLWKLFPSLLAFS